MNDKEKLLLFNTLRHILINQDSIDSKLNCDLNDYIKDLEDKINEKKDGKKPYEGSLNEEISQ